MDLYQAFHTNAKDEADGIDLHLGGDSYITIRRAGGANRMFRETFRQVTAPYRSLIDRGQIDQDLDTRLMLEIFSRAVVIGWRGVIFKGEALEFSADNFKRVMAELPELWSHVRAAAQDAATFRTTEIDNVGKP